MRTVAARLMSLRTKLMICFTLIMVSVSSIIIVSTLNTTYRHSEKQLQQRFDTSKRVLLYKLTNDSQIILDQLTALTRSATTRSLVSSLHKNPKLLERWLINQQNRVNTDFILAFDENYELVVQSEEIELEHSPSYFNNNVTIQPCAANSWQ